MSKPIWRALANKYLRDQHELMTSFGYELTRWSKGGERQLMKGHPIYEREGFEPLELSCTPRSEKTARKRLTDELRKRHPEHPMWRNHRKTGNSRGKKGRKPKTARPVLLKVVQPPPPAPVRRRVVGGPACTGCGRPWLSDLDYSSRPCPACGGVVRVPTREAA